jgi:rhodanese-related sulfurtransferase
MKVAAAPRHPDGYLQARPGDVVGADLLIIDVRPEPDLLDDFGHIHGVRNVESERILEEGLPQVPKETPLALVCSNGRTSAACAVALVQEHGFEEVYHLVGGMVRWTAEERPVARVRTWVPL